MRHLHIEERGSGKPILLIAGTGGRAAFWQGAAEILGQSYKTISFDYRDAPVWAEKEPFETFQRKVDDGLELIVQKNLSDVTVVGHSSGAIVASQMATKDPVNISKVVLSGAWAGPTPFVTESFELRLSILKNLGPEKFLADGLMRAIPPARLFRQIADQGLEGLLSFREGVDPELEAARINMIINADIREVLPKIKQECLVITTKDDTVFPPTLGNEVSNSLDKSQFVSPPLGGHLAPMMEPELWTTKVLEFLEHGNG